MLQPKDLELVTSVANQAAMFIEVNILGKKIEAEIVTRDRFSRLLSPNPAERVISGEVEVKPGGQRVEVFALAVGTPDIAGAAPAAIASGLQRTFGVATWLLVVALGLAVRAWRPVR